MQAAYVIIIYNCLIRSNLFVLVFLDESSCNITSSFIQKRNQEKILPGTPVSNSCKIHFYPGPNFIALHA